MYRLRVYVLQGGVEVNVGRVFAVHFEHLRAA